MSKKWLYRLLIWIGLTASVFIPLPAQAFPSQKQISRQIRQQLSGVESQKWLQVHRQTIKSNKLLFQFYRQRQFNPAWMTPARLQPLVQEMIHAIRQSRFDGLEPEFYHLKEIITATSAIAGNSQQRDPATSIASLDLLLSHAFLQLGRHLQRGKAGAPIANSARFLKTADNQLLEALSNLLVSGKIFSELEGLKTNGQHNKSLRQALGKYLRIKARGGWPVIPPGKALKKGDRDIRINLIKNRLLQTGDLNKSTIALNKKKEPAPVFDSVLESAIRHFQGRHGLRRSGRLNRKTRLALNLPVEKRLLQIQINMDQRRRLPRNLRRRHIIVNIPSMELKAILNKKIVLKMRVIVGKPEHQTPVLSDTIPYLVINPYWYIPPDFIKDEILPAMRKDPNYLAIRGIRLFEKMSADKKEILAKNVDWQSLTPDKINFYFRQDPGWDNSLGAIKFVMPNRQHIYLHDTPSKSLFQKSSRALSFGCVRVEQPVKLATFVLQDTRNWTESKIRRLMNIGDLQRVNLSEPVPLYLAYWTVQMDQKNRLQFLPDVYNLEPDLIASFTAIK